MLDAILGHFPLCLKKDAKNVKNFSEDEIYPVNDVNVMAKNLLEGEFLRICVIGEISGFACPSSGHWYFTLKDEKAQLRAAMFKMHNQWSTFKPKEGLQVIAVGRLTLFVARGEYQLVVERLVPAGEGALRLAFDKLKQKLELEGLFSSVHKKPIPTFPKQIGVITSSTGAAIHDVLTVLKRRFPAIPVIVYPTLVQGDLAKHQIVAAIVSANQRKECDVLLLTRGGGSLEDLWAFNEEIVVRAVFASDIPIVSAVGHEVDVTMVDFVADMRAPTPSAAAEILSPDSKQLADQLEGLMQKMTQHLCAMIGLHEKHLLYLSKRLVHPSYKLAEFSQRFDDLESRMKRAALQRVRDQKNALERLQQKLHWMLLSQQIEKHRYQLGQYQQRMSFAFKWGMQKKQEHFYGLTQNLSILNPLATLSRGYSVTRFNDGRLIKSAADLTESDYITTYFSQGSVTSVVVKVEP